MVKAVLAREDGLMDKINAIDLEPIMVKLMDSKEGEGWTKNQALKATGFYRQFLFLTVTQEEPIVPSHLIDKVWHAHILDTEKYANDCEQTFGFFVHHFPYFGLRGEDDKKALQDAYRKTQSLFHQFFGSAQPGDISDVNVKHAADSSICGCSGCNMGGGCDRWIDIPGYPGAEHVRPTFAMMGY